MDGAHTMAGSLSLPNFARSSDIKRSRPIIGILMQSLLDYSHEEWLGSVDAARANDCDVVCFAGGGIDDPEGFTAHANAIYDLVSAERLDGLVVWTTALGVFIGHERMEQFTRRFDQLPMVSVERPLHDAPSVLMDERHGMYEAVSHLIEVHRYTRLAFLRGPHTHLGAENRYQGYLDALREHGLAADPALVSEPTTSWNPDLAAAATHQILDGVGGDKIDAIVAANDDFGFGALSALDRRGLAVPMDIAVIGFDDITTSRSVDLGLQAMNDSPVNGWSQTRASGSAGTVPLTTVRAPFYEMGWRSVEMLIEKLAGRPVAPTELIPTELKVRRSCGCFPVPEPRHELIEPASQAGDIARTGAPGPQQLAAGLRTGIPGLASVAPRDWAERLVSAFMAEATGESPGTFLPVVDQLVRLSLQTGATLQPWTQALRLLRELSLAGLDTQARNRVTKLWHGVQALTSDMAERLAAYQSLLSEKRAQIVLEVGQRLISSSDTAAVADALAMELPRLGIPSCYLATYVSAEQAPARDWTKAGPAADTMCRSLLAYTDGRRIDLPPESMIFPARQLLPDGQVDRAEPRSLIAAPLYFTDQQLGFVLFEPGPRRGWIYEALQEQLSSALQVALTLEHLHDEVSQRQRAELALHEAHAELEQRVADRTAELAFANSGLTQQIAEREAAQEMQRKLEGQLRHSQKMEAIGRLAGGIAHDFNNLLVVINGNSDLLLRRIDVRDPLHQEVEDIKNAGDRAANLTRQLLAFSRQQVLHPGTVDLNGVIVGIEAMLLRLIGEHIQLKVDLAPDLDPIWADTGQLEQIIFNLIVNARDAMPRGGELTVETASAVAPELELGVGHAEAGSYVVLRIRDTGIGMDEATQARLFEPFFTTKPVGKGTGLGLATVFGIVEQSGGHIVVQSAPDHGSTFEIYLPPTKPAESATTTKSKPTNLMHGDETILLVEDDTNVRRAARRFLTMYGYSVLEAVNGTNALLVLAHTNQHIDLVITDVVMPGMGGRELTTHLASVLPGTPVLYVSGYADSTLADGLPSDVDLVQKPFTAEELVRRVREALDRE